MNDSTTPTAGGPRQIKTLLRGRPASDGAGVRLTRVIGSPDLDIMSSPDLPDIAETKAHYDIPFERYAILAFHPVTTSLHTLRHDVEEVIAAAEAARVDVVALGILIALAWLGLITTSQAFTGSM